MYFLIAKTNIRYIHRCRNISYMCAYRYRNIYIYTVSGETKSIELAWMLLKPMVYLQYRPLESQSTLKHWVKETDCSGLLQPVFKFGTIKCSNGFCLTLAIHGFITTAIHISFRSEKHNNIPDAVNCPDLPLAILVIPSDLALDYPALVDLVGQCYQAWRVPGGALNSR